MRLSNIKTLRLLHATLGMCTEIGEFADQIKRHLFYGKDLDEVNLGEEVGDISWYQRLAAYALDVEFTLLVARNIAKLQQRYPEKFSELQATVRDLDAERRVLEGGAGKDRDASR